MVEVRVNGETFNLFKQVDISSSMDDMCSEARIIVSEQVDDQSFIIIGDEIEILLDGIPKLTGYVDKLGDGEDNETHDISYRCRDKIQDLIDSSIPDNVKTLEGVKSFKDICQLCIDGLGMDIEVVDEIGATFSDELKAGRTGQKCGEFLQEYAKKVQVILNTDGLGNLLIRRPTKKLQTILLNSTDKNNNIKNSNIDVDYSERFYKYIVRSNNNVSAKKSKNGSLNNLGEAIDPEIRQTRICEIISDTSMTEEECKNAAEEEANIRRIRGFNYTCTVTGFSANGELWEDGYLVKVKDEKKGVIGLFLIRDCNYSNSNSGEVVNMTLTYPDAYKPQAEQTPTEKKITQAASTYTVIKGDTLSEIAFRNNIKLSNLIQANPQIKDPDLIFTDQVINIPVERK